MNQNKKLALITGASSGIGLELARVFAKENYNLIIVSGKERIEDTAKLLRQYDAEVKAVKADLSTLEGVESLYSEIQTMGRPLDVAVLNAGVGVSGQFIETDFNDELYLMNLNMVYLVCLTKKILKDMVARNE